MKKRPSPRTEVRGDGLPASLRQCRQLKRQASLRRHCHEMPPSLREVASPRGDDGRSRSYSWLLLPMIAGAYLPLTPSGASRQLPQRGSHTPRWGQSYFVHRGVYTRDDCEAGANTGCGNPLSPSKPRPSSKSGGSNGGGAPLVVGEGVQRGPPRNRSPLARLCLLSPRCERRSLPQERNIPRPIPVPPQRAKPPSPSLRSRCAHRLWQSVFPIQTPSLVPRKLRGISRGPQPPGRWGRIPRPYSPEYGAGMMVTPREIDQQTALMARLLGYGIDLALHDLSVGDVTALVG